jgi:uncharacterized protein (DUF58 family)
MANSSATSAASPVLRNRAGRHFRQRLLRVDARDALPLRLKHERIYILPTPRGLAFVAVALVMILASMNYGLNLGYALSFILVGLFAACLLSTYLNLSNLTLQSITSEDTFAGTPLAYELMFQESTGRNRYSIAVASTCDKAIIDVGANKQSSAMLLTRVTHRGEYQLGRVTISSDFPLGLWRGWGYVHAPTCTYVYPKPELPPPAFPLSPLKEQGSKTPTPHEREFDQLKRYQTTDSPASVAWKTVASGRGWFSKEFTTTESGDDLQFAWSDTDELPEIEQRLSRLCAWIIRADATATPYAYTGRHDTAKVALGPEHRRRCLRQLATFSSPPQ